MSDEIKKNLEQRVKKHFSDSIETKQKAAETMSEDIVRAINLMHQALASEKKILACGNGGSAADAQHFAAELVGRFERERRELPAIALSTDSSILTAIANDYSYEVIFSKQVRALGHAGDVLLGISTSGNSANVIAAIEAAHLKGMSVIAFTGKDGGKIKNILKNSDVHLCVPADRTARYSRNTFVVVALLV